MNRPLLFRAPLLTLVALTILILTACATTPPINPPTPSVSPTTVAVQVSSPTPCPITPAVWTKPPQDDAIPDAPAFGYYYQNQDASIMAGAWWTAKEAESLRAGEPGIKTGWFRPAGAPLEITARRLDGTAPPFHADVPCCYPTRFQATGLYFPTAGCWQVTARAAKQELSFVVQVYP